MLRMEGEAEPRGGCDYLNSSFFALILSQGDSFSTSGLQNSKFQRICKTCHSSPFHLGEGEDLG